MQVDGLRVDFGVVMTHVQAAIAAIEPQDSGQALIAGRLVILGGGSIGCELGQAFARLGAQVTILEAAPRLLMSEDPDAANTIAAALTQDGACVRTGAAAVAVHRDVADHGVVDIDDRGYVHVDGRLRTTNRRIWAAGAITGHPQFTHTAGVHGSLAATNAVLGLRRRTDLTEMPRVTFTQPQVAASGSAQPTPNGMT